MGCRRIRAVIAVVFGIYMRVIMCPLIFWRYRVAVSYYHPPPPPPPPPPPHCLDINSSYKALVFGHNQY